MLLGGQLRQCNRHREEGGERREEGVCGPQLSPESCSWRAVLAGELYRECVRCPLAWLLAAPGST